MSGIHCLLITRAFQVSSKSFIIEDCTFHGITLMFEDTAPIYLNGKFDFFEVNSKFKIMRSVISQCICVKVPNEASAGALSVFCAKISINQCLMLGCFGHFATIKSDRSPNNKINNSITTQCTGSDFNSIFNGVQSYHNISQIDIETMNFGAENNFKYCCFESIKNCLQGFGSYYSTNNISFSNFNKCYIFTMKGFYTNSYFMKSKFSSIEKFENCFFDESCEIPKDVNKTHISELPNIEIKKFEEYTIQQEELEKENEEFNQSLNISFTYNDIKITNCIFMNITIDTSIDTVILMQNSLIKNVVVKYSYFKYIQTGSSAGLIYMSRHRSDYSMNIKSNYISEVYNTLASTINIGYRTDLAKENSQRLNITSYLFKYDNPDDQFSNSLITTKMTAMRLSNSNITTKNYQMSFLIYATIYNDNEIHENLFDYDNFGNISGIRCFFAGDDFSFSCCNFIDVKVYNYSYSMFYYEFVNCTFINSTIPDMSFVKDSCFDDDHCVLYRNSLHPDWATPKPFIKPRMNPLVIAGICFAVVLVIGFISVGIFVLYQNKVVKEYKERIVLEKNIMNDFG